CSPVSGLDVMFPSNGGKPAALLAMITAAAPACCPKIAFATRAQVPRLTTAIWLPPGTIPAFVKALGEQPRDSSAEPMYPGRSVVVAALSCSTISGRLVSGSPSVDPLALIA